MVGLLLYCADEAMNGFTKLQINKNRWKEEFKSLLIQRQVLPHRCTPTRLPRQEVTTTANGSFDMSLSVSLADMQLPEFVNGQTIDGIAQAKIFDSPDTRYNKILGKNFLKQAQINLQFKDKTVQWINLKIDMKASAYFNANLADNALFVD